MYQVFIQPEPGLTKSAYLTGELLLPAAPIGPINRNISSLVRTTETANNGTFAWPTGPALRNVSFSSMFPEPYGAGAMPPWCHQGAPYREPDIWGTIMTNLAKDGTIFRLFIADDEALDGASDDTVFANWPAVIQSYSDYQDEGDALYYTVSFMEFREIVVRKVKKQVKIKGFRGFKTNVPRPSRSGSKPKPSSAPVHTRLSAAQIRAARKT